jgi:hypothetical protein
MAFGGQGYSLKSFIISMMIRPIRLIRDATSNFWMLLLRGVDLLDLPLLRFFIPHLPPIGFKKRLVGDDGHDDNILLFFPEFSYLFSFSMGPDNKYYVNMHLNPQIRAFSAIFGD